MCFFRSVLSGRWLRLHIFPGAGRITTLVSVSTACTAPPSMAKKTARSVSGAKRVSAAKPIRRAWQYCPKCGQPGVERGKNPFRCQSCGYTHFFGPVSAVGAITTDAAGQVLLLVRAKDPGKGKYGLPGGFIDAGETAEEALHREVREETGLRVRSSHYLASFPNEYVYQGFILPVTDLFFVTEALELFIRHHQ